MSAKSLQKLVSQTVGTVLTCTFRSWSRPRCINLTLSFCITICHKHRFTKIGGCCPNNSFMVAVIHITILRNLKCRTHYKTRTTIYIVKMYYFVWYLAGNGHTTLLPSTFTKGCWRFISIRWALAHVLYFELLLISQFIYVNLFTVMQILSYLYMFTYLALYGDSHKVIKLSKLWWIQEKAAHIILHDNAGWWSYRFCVAI